MGSIKHKDGYCIKCNDDILKPCIGKRDKALCASRHYWEEHKKSDKQADLDRQFAKLKRDFLRTRRYCRFRLEGCTIRATDVHHTRGHGIYYLDVDTFAETCRNCHSIVQVNSEFAYQNGYSEKRLNKYGEDPPKG